MTLDRQIRQEIELINDQVEQQAIKDTQMESEMREKKRRQELVGATKEGLATERDKIRWMRFSVFDQSLRLVDSTYLIWKHNTRIAVPFQIHKRVHHILTFQIRDTRVLYSRRVQDVDIFCNLNLEISFACHTCSHFLLIQV